MKSRPSLNSGKSERPTLVEECQKISINTYIRAANEKLKEALLAAETRIGNKTIELVLSKNTFGGVIYWFKCPLCGKRMRTLFAHPLTSEIGCRHCLGLEYKSRRYKGMIEANSQPRSE